MCRVLAQICITRKAAAHASICVLDAALFAMAMGVAEVGVDTERIVQFVMVGEPGAIVLCEGRRGSVGKRDNHVRDWASVGLALRLGGFASRTNRQVRS
jgi:hypothetical protein